MPAKYSIKRNSLSSKWGIWAFGTDESSTVEKLIAEVRSQEQAEAYCARIEAGESHEAIIASFSAKKPKQEGGGFFGRFRKRSSAAAEETTTSTTVSNPVIEIETVEKEAETTEVAAVEVETEPAAVMATEAPSRYQVIEQPKAPEPQTVPEPVVTPEAVAEPERVAEVVEEVEEVQAPEATPEPRPEPDDLPTADVTIAADETETAPVETDSMSAEGERVKMVASPASLSDKVKAAFGKTRAEEEPEVPAEVEPTTPVSIEPKPSTDEAGLPEEPAARVEEAPAKVSKAESSSISEADFDPGQKQEKVVEPEIQTVAPVEQQKEPEVAATPADEQEDGSLVNWTFTPPPDITPEELKASGQQVPQAAEPEERPQPAPPVVAKAPVAEAPVEAPAQKLKAPEVSAPKKSAVPASPASPVGKVDSELKPPAQFKPNEPVKQSAEKSAITMEVGIPKAVREAAVGDPRVSDKKYNKVASKEYTEVSKAFAAGNSPDTLREELIHLAAVCLAWADAIEKRKTGKDAKKAA